MPLLLVTFFFAGAAGLDAPLLNNLDTHRDPALSAFQLESLRPEDLDPAFADSLADSPPEGLFQTELQWDQGVEWLNFGCHGTSNKCGAVSERYCWEHGSYFEATYTFPARQSELTVSWDVCKSLLLKPAKFSITMTIDSRRVALWNLTTPFHLSGVIVPLDPPVGAGAHLVRFEISEAVTQGLGSVTLGGWRVGFTTPPPVTTTTLANTVTQAAAASTTNLGCNVYLDKFRVAEAIAQERRDEAAAQCGYMPSTLAERSTDSGPAAFQPLLPGITCAAAAAATALAMQNVRLRRRLQLQEVPLLG